MAISQMLNCEVCVGVFAASMGCRDLLYSFACKAFFFVSLVWRSDSSREKAGYPGDLKLQGAARKGHLSRYCWLGVGTKTLPC